jgi:hypothetical protein
MRGRVDLTETVAPAVTVRLPGAEDPATDAAVLNLT